MCLGVYVCEGTSGLAQLTSLLIGLVVKCFLIRCVYNSVAFHYHKKLADGSNSSSSSSSSSSNV